MASPFAWADVLLLPWLCERSAMVACEVLAASLPVVCKPNTSDGAGSFVVPIRDSTVIDPVPVEPPGSTDLRRSMSDRARHGTDPFDLAAHGHHLTDTPDYEARGRP
jgi:hypothetical protein